MMFAKQLVTSTRLRYVGAIVLVVALADPASAQQAIKVDGSTGTAPLVAALGKAFEANGGAPLEIGKGMGTRVRFEALANNQIGIAMASHGLNVRDITARGMVVHTTAKTPVAFVVHASVSLSSLTAAQLCSIYTGNVSNWNELGGPDLPLVAFTRPDSEVDAEVVRDQISCFKDLKKAENVRVAQRAGDMARAVADTPGAIGVASTTVVEQSKGAMKALALDGVQPTEANVMNGTWRMTRDAFLVTSGSPSPDVVAFIRFVKGSEGAKLIRANGAIPAGE